MYVKRKGIGHTSIMDGVPATVERRDCTNYAFLARFVKHLDAINDNRLTNAPVMHALRCYDSMNASLN